MLSSKFVETILFEHTANSSWFEQVRLTGICHLSILQNIDFKWLYDFVIPLASVPQNCIEISMPDYQGDDIE